MVVPARLDGGRFERLGQRFGRFGDVSAFWAVSCGCVGHARRLAIPAAACNSLSCNGDRAPDTPPMCASIPLAAAPISPCVADDGNGRFHLKSGENGDTLVFSGPMTVRAGGLDARLREIETPIARIDLADVPMMDTVGPGPAGACRAIPVPKSSTHAKRRNA
jgi:hypothetical protein